MPASAFAIETLAGSAGCVNGQWSGGWQVDDCGSFAESGEDAVQIAMSPDGAHLYTGGWRGIVRLWQRDTATGVVTAGSCWGSAPSCSATLGLEGQEVTSLVVSGDGNQLYVGTEDARIITFARDATTGALTQAAVPDACHGDWWSQCTLAWGLDYGVGDLELSDDGSSLYATSQYGAVAVFRRDTMTGRLSQAAGSDGCVHPDDVDRSGVRCTSPDPRFWYPGQLRVAPDGARAWLADYDSLIRFDRDPADGSLTPVGCMQWVGDAQYGCQRSELWLGAHALELTGDGTHLYVGGSGVLAGYAIDAATGQLTQLPGSGGCVQNARWLETPCASGRGFAGWTWDIALSPDEAVLYASTPDGLLVFDRDLTTGALTQRAGRRGCIVDDPLQTECTVTATEVAGWGDLAVSPDGANVYVASYSGHLVTFGSPAASCPDQTRHVRRDTTLQLQLDCVGLDPDVESLSIVSGPTNGTLSAVEPVSGRATYTPSAGFVGTDTVTYRASDGVTTTATGTITITVREPSPPVAVVAPSIVGTAQLGELLALDVGTWSTPSRVEPWNGSWERCDAALTSCSYVGWGLERRVIAADVGSRLRRRVAASNADGTTSAYAVTDVVTDPGGPPLRVVGTVPTLRPGGWMRDPVQWFSTGTLTVTQAWERCDTTLASCIPLSGTATYSIVSEDEGSRIRVTSSATNDVGTSVEVVASDVVQPSWLRRMAGPVISGTPLVGETLTATDGVYSGPAISTWERQWRRCDDDGAPCQDIAGATGSTYLLTSADVGSVIEFYERVEAPGDWYWSMSDSTAEVRDPAQVGQMQPVNVELPEVSAPSVGSWAYSYRGHWEGLDPMTYAFQWLRCDGTGASCVAVSGATWRTIQVRFEDVGATFRVQVTATNADGSASVTSAASAPVPDPPPIPATSPLVGTWAEVGETLTATTGTWQSTLSISGWRYSWYSCARAWFDWSCGLVQDGAGASYVIALADLDRYIAVRVEATNAAGTGRSMLAWSARVAHSMPINTSLPTISGSATEGSLLTASPGAWSSSGSVSYLYEWRTCELDGSGCWSIGGREATWVVPAWAEHRTIRVYVRAYAPGLRSSRASSDAISAQTAAVPLKPPRAGTTPTTSGGIQLGDDWALRHTNDIWWNSPATVAVSRQWERCDGSGANCVAIAGATGLQYALTVDDLAARIRVTQTGTNDAGSTSISSAASEPILPPDPVPDWNDRPTISGTLREGSTVTATLGGWTSMGSTAYEVQWRRCEPFPGTCSDIAGATGTTYQLIGADARNYMQVRVTATNAAASASMYSYQTSWQVAPLPPVATGSVEVAGSHRVGSTVSVTGTSWSSSVPVTERFSWHACEVDATGCVQLGGGSSLVVPEAAFGLHLRASAHASNGGATVSQYGVLGPVVQAAPFFTREPSLDGIGRLGSDLAVAASVSGSQPLNVTRAWLRCASHGGSCIVIAGAVEARYALATADIGRYVMARVTAQNAFGTLVATSPGVLVSGDGPTQLSFGSIEQGAGAVVGAIQRYRRAHWQHADSVHLQWERCAGAGFGCAAVPGANGSDYVPTLADRGRYLRVRETATNPAGVSGMTSNVIGPIVLDPSLLPMATPQLPAFTTAASVYARWVSPTGDAVPLTWTAYVRSATRVRRMSGWLTLLRDGVERRARLSLVPGETRCLALSARADGRIGARGPARCITRLQAASAASASVGWQRAGTARRSSRRGAVLLLRATQPIERIAVSLLRCPSCGRARVEWNGRLLRTIDLRGRRGAVTWISPTLASVRPGTLRVRVLYGSVTVTRLGLQVRP